MTGADLDWCPGIREACALWRDAIKRPQSARLTALCAVHPDVGLTFISLQTDHTEPPTFKRLIYMNFFISSQIGIAPPNQRHGHAHVHKTPVFERESPFMFEKSKFFNMKVVSC
ncbi:MAG: hypothetical protein ACK5NY_05455 [Burkholderiaceae bacterium]